MNLENTKFSVDDDGVATITIDVAGESQNTLSPKLSEDFFAVLDRIESDDKIKAAVLISGKKDTFVAGADIKWFQTLKTKEDGLKGILEGQAMFNRMEGMFEKRGVPTVAAIHGPALGGGLEIALACTERICSNSPKTQLGLPEVQIGVLPAAGGTQRLPRLIGLVSALDMILTGKKVRPRKAKKLGIVSEVVPEPALLAAAKKRALKLAKAGKKTDKKSLSASLRDPNFYQSLALEKNPLGLNAVFAKAEKELLKKTRGNYPAPEKALDCIKVGLKKGITKGLEAEAEHFSDLLISKEARALQSIFFATIDLKKENGVDDASVKARPINKVGVLGGGLMGGGIAAVNVRTAKLPTRINEVDYAGVGRGKQYLQKMLNKDVKRRIRSKAQADHMMQHLSGTTNYSGFANADVVIEAVFEDVGLKQKVLQAVEEAGRDDVIFATNTSSLPITEIAKGSKHPETVIGMHYFSPVEKMPLLEIIVHPGTADWVTATCVELGKMQGKTVIVVNDGTGFYTSRILGPYMNETAYVMAEGAPVDVIDNALMDWGFPVGPVTLLDEVGIDVGVKVAGIMLEAFGDRMQAPGTLNALIDDERFGRKNNRGFYLYENGKKGKVDESVYGVLGITPNPGAVAKQEIQERLGLLMVNEAALCLQEDILRNPRDGDIGAIFGLGFPPFTGGPFSYVDLVGADTVVGKLEGYAAQHGERFKPAEILKDYAKSGKKFRS